MILPLLPGFPFSLFLPSSKLGLAVWRYESWGSNQKLVLKGYVQPSRVICLVIAYHFLWLSRGRSSQAYGELARKTRIIVGVTSEFESWGGKKAVSWFFMM